jgi:hypothetical protein
MAEVAPGLTTPTLDSRGRPDRVKASVLSATGRSRAPCYSARPMRDRGEDRLRTGREALQRHAWHEAFEPLHAG